VTFENPTATDIVDASVPVSCDPSSGSTFPAGTTTVTCTATDDSGNSTSASFTVTVSRLAVLFGEPVGSSRMVTVHSGRTLPIKVQIVRAGAPDQTGPVSLGLTQLGTCPASATKAGASGKGAAARDRRLGSVRSSSIDTSFHWDAGAERWTYSLDLGDWGLVAGACYRADVIDDGVAAASFTIAVGD
jgi:HYR domain